jgi:hypothetical protein
MEGRGWFATLLPWLLSMNQPMNSRLARKRIFGTKTKGTSNELQHLVDYVGENDIKRAIIKMN